MEGRSSDSGMAQTLRTECANTTTTVDSSKLTLFVLYY